MARIIDFLSDAATFLSGAARAVPVEIPAPMALVGGPVDAACRTHSRTNSVNINHRTDRAGIEVEPTALSSPATVLTLQEQVVDWVEGGVPLLAPGQVPPGLGAAPPDNDGTFRVLLRPSPPLLLLLSLRHDRLHNTSLPLHLPTTAKTNSLPPHDAR